MITVDSGTSNGVCLIYDALLRMVEQQKGSSCNSSYQQMKRGLVLEPQQWPWSSFCALSICHPERSCRARSARQRSRRTPCLPAAPTGLARDSRHERASFEGCAEKSLPRRCWVPASMGSFAPPRMTVKGEGAITAPAPHLKAELGQHEPMRPPRHAAEIQKDENQNRHHGSCKQPLGFGSQGSETHSHRRIRRVA